MDEDSIEHIVTRRLDSLFSEDDEDGAEGTPKAPTRRETSPLGRLEEAAEALKSGIDPGKVERLTSEIRALQGVREGNPLYRPLLKMISMLADYLRAALQSADRDALQAVYSIIDCMDCVEPDRATPDAEKRRRVHREIESFKAFRSKIQAGKRAEPAPAPPEQEASAEVAGEPPVPPSETAPPSTQQPPDPVPEAAPPPSRTPEATPVEEEPSSPRAAVEPPDLEPLRESVAALSLRTDEILKTLQGRSALDKELRDTMAGMEKGLAGLASLPAAVQALEKAVKAIPAPPPDPRNDLRTCIRDAVDELSGGLEEVRGVPSGLREMRQAVDEAFSRLEERMKYLRGEINAIRADLGALRSEVEGLQGPARPGNAVEGPVGGEAGEEERMPDRAEPAQAPESREESPPEPEPSSPLPEERPGAATWTYFAFRAGGKMYAVDEPYVVKSSKSPGGLLEKGRDQGWLTLADSAPGLFSTRKGLEPAWNDVTSSDWKRMHFQLVPGETLEGLNETSGEGVLFLGAGDERRVLFTDRPAERITLGHEDEVQMAGGAAPGSGAVRGSILRAGDGSEFYLILDPERL